MNQKMERLNDDYLPKSQLATKLRVDLSRLQGIELHFILSKDNQEKQSLYLQSKKVIADIIDLLDQYRLHPLLTAQEAQYLLSFNNSWQTYIEIQPLIMLQLLPQINPKLQNAVSVKRLTLYYEMSKDASALMDFNNNAMVQISQEIAKTYNRSQQLIIFAMLVSLAVGTALINFFQKQINQQKKLQHQAERDELTGLYNRRFLFEQGNAILKNSQGAAIIMADIDHFKSINDRYGHDGGDNALRAVTQHMLRHFRSGDIIVRYGGEEFIILLPNTRLAKAKQIAERLRQEIAQLVCYSPDGEAFSFTVSLGVVEQNDGQSDLSQLLSAVDKYLYQAKDNGRNQVASPDLPLSSRAD